MRGIEIEREGDRDKRRYKEAESDRGREIEGEGGGRRIIDRDRERGREIETEGEAEKKRD